VRSSGKIGHPPFPGGGIAGIQLPGVDGCDFVECGLAGNDFLPGSVRLQWNHLDVEFLYWLLTLARASVSPGPQLIQRQVRSKIACESAAGAWYDKWGERVFDAAEQENQKYDNPFGGPTDVGPGSDPEVPQTYPDAGFLVGRALVSYGYNAKMRACTAQNPLTGLAP
jgi:hypothetical protein